MSQLPRTEGMCAFCMLVIQTGYEHLTPAEIEMVAFHMRESHGLKRFSISR